MAETLLSELAKHAKAASRVLAASTSAERDEALAQAAEMLRQRCEEILRGNESDLRRARDADQPAAVIDRLGLSEARVEAMAQGVEAVSRLADPVGETVDGWVLPNGATVRRVRVPLGVVGIIYENRPNVTSDAAAICIKSGNAAFLRGSSGALESNRVIAAALREGIAKAGLPADSVILVEDTARDTVKDFVRLRGLIDCVIPRGGKGLVETVLENASVPVVLDGDGNCHVYVDATADLDMAEKIVVNAKMQRPSVCNAMETLLVHEAVAGTFLPRIAAALEGVELRGDAATCGLVPGAKPATDDDFATEFLALILAVAVVPSLDAAIDHITRFSSGHSEAIVTSDVGAARRFVREVDAAAVLVNASTRLVDGGELGFGAEIGISTQKLHARGPMSVHELTCVKFVIEGDGQVRL